MLIKVMILFLVAMVVLAIFGRLRLPQIRRQAALSCSHCGRPRIGTGPCPCTKE
jgi:hypothetical protein